MNIELIKTTEKSCNLKEKKAAGKLIIQIYEIQTPKEAEIMIGLGVNHLGSVILSKDSWKNSIIKETVNLSKNTSAKSSILPLYSDADMIYRTADYYEPDIIHFCEDIYTDKEASNFLSRMVKNHEGFRKRFPQIKIMRSIPIGSKGAAASIPTITLSEIFKPLCDFFLTDTLIFNPNGEFEEQHERGFIGITGKTCDWDMAKNLVNNCKIPVILAGGISPDNVYESILKVRPAGVDSCTYTNAVNEKGRSYRFKKDQEKVKRLIEAVCKAEKEIV